MSDFRILPGDALEVLRTLPDESVHCCVTSPPYWGLRDYGVAGQLGLEKTPEEYVASMVAVFREVRRVLRADGTLWVNIGDSYVGSGMTGGTGSKEGSTKRHDRMFHGNRRDTVPGLKPKDLTGIPWMVAFALRADGWYLRSDIIWHKPNPMPESVTDRPTKAHEYIFLLSKSERYGYNADAIREAAIGQSAHDLTGPGYSAPGQTPQTGSRKVEALRGSHGTMGHDGKGMRMPEKWSNPAGRNKRTVWTVSTCPTPEAHFATYPPDLIEPCILAGSPEGGTVLDPFNGAGTTGLACLKHGRKYIGIELNPDYVTISENRARKYYPLLIGETA